MSDRDFHIGDEVYIFERGNFLSAIRNSTFIKGTITGYTHEDYGYHGSGDWVWIYEVMGEDGKLYHGDYTHGYAPYILYREEDIINNLNRYISGSLYHQKKVYEEEEKNILEYQTLIEFFKNTINKGKQKRKERK